MSEKDCLDKIIDSKELSQYEKMCVLFLIDMHIDKIIKENGLEKV